MLFVFCVALLAGFVALGPEDGAVVIPGADWTGPAEVGPLGAEPGFSDGGALGC